MKEHPIPFKSEMVQAILAGGKTQTRRVIVPPRSCRKLFPGHTYYPGDRWWVGGHPSGEGYWAIDNPDGPGSLLPSTQSCGFLCPYGVPGDRLWVRETWKPHCDEGNLCTCVKFAADGGMMKPTQWTDAQGYWCEENEETTEWHPSIFMPRYASRITLEVVSVRVQRIQEINNEDIQAEGTAGLHPCGGAFPIQWQERFRSLWDSINAKRGFGWKLNPWVWAIEFKNVSE